MVLYISTFRFLHSRREDRRLWGDPMSLGVWFQFPFHYLSFQNCRNSY
jgi:hypothetical protein